MIPKTITIPAAGGGQSGVYVEHAHGKYFYCSAANGAFRAITSTGDEYSFSESGSGFGNDNSQPFGKVNFYNDTGAAVTITFYISLTPIRTADVSVQSSITVNSQLTNTLAGCAAATLADAVVSAPALSASKAFALSSTPFRKITILAYKAFGATGSSPTANTGVVYIGVTNTHQPIAMNPGDVWTFEAPTGAKYDLISFYISAPNSGDGVIIIYS